MTEIKVKQEFAGTVVGFGKGSLPLGKRDDLEELAVMALQANDKHILNMFDSLPTLQELQDAKASKISASMKAAVPAKNTPVKPEFPKDKIG